MGGPGTHDVGGLERLRGRQRRRPDERRERRHHRDHQHQLGARGPGHQVGPRRGPDRPVGHAARRRAVAGRHRRLLHHLRRQRLGALERPGRRRIGDDHRPGCAPREADGRGGCHRRQPRLRRRPGGTAGQRGRRLGRRPPGVDHRHAGGDPAGGHRGTVAPRRRRGERGWRRRRLLHRPRSCQRNARTVPGSRRRRLRDDSRRGRPVRVARLGGRHRRRRRLRHRPGFRQGQGRARC